MIRQYNTRMPTPTPSRTAKNKEPAAVFSHKLANWQTKPQSQPANRIRMQTQPEMHVKTSVFAIIGHIFCWPARWPR